jgi:hypothetical protein
VVKRHPYHRIAHEHMLQYLCRKWFGSHEEMFDFARAAAAAAPPGDPLGYLVAVAHVEQWLDLPDEEDLAYLQRPDVLAELHAAVDRTVRHPAFVRRPGWPVIPNWYAFAFSCGHQWPAAAEQFDLIGDLAYGPWGYIRGDEVGEFLDLRELAYELRS